MPVGGLVDGYRIESLIAKGGMGEVYLAFDTVLHRPVAVKMVSTAIGQDPEFVARFEREARAASAVNHPNVAQIYAFGRWRGRPYYVMEHIDGHSLAELVRQGPVTGFKCIAYLRQACEGLRAAARQGIIHRDIKPGNLMVDGEDRLKIVDFGLARRQSGDAALTRTDMVLGTPAYMAPEQAVTAEVDFRADIYSLGATFYHVLTGQPLFTGDTPIAVMMKHVNEPPQPIRERNPRVPTALARVVDRMLCKRPEDRFQSYDELLGCLEIRPGLGARPALAGPLPAPRQAASGKERRGSFSRWAIGGAVALVALVLLVFHPGTSDEEHPDQTSPQSSRESSPQSSFESSPQTSPEISPPAASPASDPDSPRARRRPEIPEAWLESEYIRTALRASTLATLRQLASIIELLWAERGQLPASLDEVRDSSGLDPEDLLDAWERPITLEPREPDGYRLRSAGPDGVEGNEDDVVVEDRHGVAARSVAPFLEALEPEGPYEGEPP